MLNTVTLKLLISFPSKILSRSEHLSSTSVKQVSFKSNVAWNTANNLKFKINDNKATIVKDAFRMALSIVFLLNPLGQSQTRGVRGSNYSPAMVPSEEEDKLVTENWRDGKKEEIKGRISISSLIPVYTIYRASLHVCIKFQLSMPHSSWEKKLQQFQCLETGEKVNEEIKGWISTSSPILAYTTHWFIVHARSEFPLVGIAVPEKYGMQILKLEKLERKKNEKTEMNKQQPDSSIHDTSTHCPYVYQVSTL